jgi:hypothetical protein
MWAWARPRCRGAAGCDAADEVLHMLPLVMRCESRALAAPGAAVACAM